MNDNALSKGDVNMRWVSSGKYHSLQIVVGCKQNTFRAFHIFIFFFEFEPLNKI